MTNMMTAIVLAMLLANCQNRSSDPLRPTDADRAAADQQGAMLTTDRDSYSRNQDLRLTLRNDTQESLGFNLCMSRLERRQGDQWLTVTNFPPDPCPATLEIMAPARSASFVFSLGGALSTGEYRFRTRVEFMASAEDRWLTSNSFQFTG